MKIIEEFTFEQLRDIANGGIRNANNITGEGKELNR
jgi:hypothetical protein